MANKVTEADKLNINRAYKRLGTYAAAARETGFSAGTVKKYVIDNFIDPDDIQLHIFSGEIKPIQEIKVKWDLRLSDNEFNEIKELWKEIAI